MTKRSLSFSFDRKSAVKSLSVEQLKNALQQMLLIRQFEMRAEGAYQQGKVGGFFHSYIGQEAVQTAAVDVFGQKQWYITTYRCHALALLLGTSPESVMAELYGKETGCAKGRGGSMHMYADRLLGGFGIVGGQLPIAAGAAFSLKYQKVKEGVAVCFLGDGAVAQGAFHESLNLCALWNLPCIYVIENNLWGMGTDVKRALAVPQEIAAAHAPAYGIEGFTFDGMDYIQCHAGFTYAFEQVKLHQKPILIEVLTQRFKGHSISDPALYRSKEELGVCLLRDPLILLRDELIKQKIVSLDDVKELEKEMKARVLQAIDFAENSPHPDPSTLEQDVLAPEN